MDITLNEGEKLRINLFRKGYHLNQPATRTMQLRDFTLEGRTATRAIYIGGERAEDAEENDIEGATIEITIF